MADPFRQDFGASLREARERAGITLRHIAANTKISVLTLEALERNDLSRLPGGLFTRAFVRAYAREVGLDPEETLTHFLRRFPEVAGDAELKETVSDALVEREPRTGAGRALRVVAWLLPIAAGIAYFAFVRSGLEVASVTAPRAAVSRPPVPAPPATVPPEVPAANPAGTASAEQPGVEPAAVPAVAEPAADEGAPAPGEAPPAAAAPGSTLPADRMRVTLAATGACWISLVAADGQSIFSGLMQQGERREFEVRGEVSLKAGDAGALALAVNGEAARALGEAGRVVTVRFSPATFRGLLPPR